MISSRPYLIRALYDWIVDSALTPHILVDACAEGVQLPDQGIKDGKMVLNVAPQAVRTLNLGNDVIEFSARFGGVSRQVTVPVVAVVAVYARENGQGMMFANDEGDEKGDLAESNTASADGSETADAAAKGPHLTVVK